MQNTMKEEWRDIKDYEGLYQISNLGRVKSLNYNRTGREGIMKLDKNKYGYLYICLFKNGVKKHFRVHRLVAKTFIPNPHNLPEVNHKDENCINNFVYINEDGTVNLEKSNIEWCTTEYNHNYGTHNERIAASNRGKYNKNTSKQVFQYDLDNNLINIFPSGKEVQRQLGFDQSAISACCLGKRNTCGGFKWKYAV